MLLFFLSDSKELHLFMIGVGLIGSTLIKQIKEQAAYLKEKQSLEIKIVGLSNSKKMLFNPEGIDLDNWKESLVASASKTSFAGFIKQMKELNLSNTIFIDNTANKEIDKYYQGILDNSIFYFNTQQDSYIFFLRSISSIKANSRKARCSICL